jgi:hypothetical protein
MCSTGVMSSDSKECSQLSSKQSSGCLSVERRNSNSNGESRQTGTEGRHSGAGSEGTVRGVHPAHHSSDFPSSSSSCAPCPVVPCCPVLSCPVARLCGSRRPQQRSRTQRETKRRRRGTGEKRLTQPLLLLCLPARPRVSPLPLLPSFLPSFLPFRCCRSPVHPRSSRDPVPSSIPPWCVCRRMVSCPN